MLHCSPALEFNCIADLHPLISSGAVTVGKPGWTGYGKLSKLRAPLLRRPHTGLEEA
jgi:hypothetical protein